MVQRFCLLIAAVAATGLITWYCSHFLDVGMRTLVIGADFLAVGEIERAKSRAQQK